MSATPSQNIPSKRVIEVHNASETQELSGGLDPEERQYAAGYVPASVNEAATRRQHAERDGVVQEWLTGVNERDPLEYAIAAPVAKEPEWSQTVGDLASPLVEDSVNIPMAGQAYFSSMGGILLEPQLDILRQQPWLDAPRILDIAADRGKSHRYQPESSQAAISKYETRCHDNDSDVSKAATTGTRRNSLQGSIPDNEISLGHVSRQEPVSEGGAVALKQKESLEDWIVQSPEAMSSCLPSPVEKQDSPKINLRKFRACDRCRIRKIRCDHRFPSCASCAAAGLACLSYDPISRKEIPRGEAYDGETRVEQPGNLPNSSNTLFSPAKSMEMSSLPGAYTSSISPDLSRGKYPSSQAVPSGPVKEKNLHGLISNVVAGHSQLKDTWKGAGGPAVVMDSDDAELDGATPLNASANINPTFAGFREHVLQLNPSIAENAYLVDRIAHQQVIRYKTLLKSRITHLNAGALCTSGAHCTNNGALATALQSDIEATQLLKPYKQGFLDMEDEEGEQDEYLISPESFPSQIPMPPTTVLPAMFECQLCFHVKKFQKPSDWVKHVHEDLQPFTCTWEKCRDPKSYKRKADWIRHENEGHRQLEWWTCDVDHCRHTCYRRDNFVQHLVREHKFSEPKVKTKAAIRRTRGIEPIWETIERCHRETTKTPQDEACRFCSKTFPTWKKLVVHLAKHMEQITLPLVSLAESATVQEDSIISPVMSPRRAMPPPSPTALLANPYQGFNSDFEDDGHYPLASPAISPDGHYAQPLFQGFSSNATAFPTTYEYSSGSPISLPGYTEKSPMAVDLAGTSRAKRGQSGDKPGSFGAGSPVGDMLTPVYTPNPTGISVSSHFDASEWLKKPDDEASPTGTSKFNSWFFSGSQKAYVDEVDVEAANKSAFLETIPSGIDAMPLDSTKDASTQTLVGENQIHMQPRNPQNSQSPVPEEAGVVSSPEPSSTVQLAGENLPLLKRLATRMRQVGVAKIAVELLSLSAQYRSRMASRVQEEDDSEYDSAEDDEQGSCVDDEDGDSGGSRNTNNPAPNSNSNSAQTESGSHPTTACRPPRRERPEDDEGEGGDERQQKRPKPCRASKNQTPPQQRFACPYQAFEGWRDCFRPTRRNPGGCDGIKRLKHHLIRRHMVSQRCNRCWIYVVTSQKLEEHQRDGKCRQTEQPPGECFMDLELEAIVRESHGALSEDVWWNLFRLLIPGKQQTDLSVLKQEYYPYYIRMDSSLMIPALTFSDGTFSFGDMTFPTPGPDESSTVLDEGSSNMQSNDNAVQTDPPSHITNDTPIAALQSFIAPIYAMPLAGPSPTSDVPAATQTEPGNAIPDQSNTGNNNGYSMIIDPSVLGTPSLSTMSYPPPSSTAPTPMDTTYLSSAMTMATPSSTTISMVSAPELTQLQREYDILKLRNTQMAEECTEASEAMRASRVDIETAQSMLYKVLSMPEVQGEVYSQLLDVVKLVSAVGRRLK